MAKLIKFSRTKTPAKIPAKPAPVSLVGKTVMFPAFNDPDTMVAGVVSKAENGILTVKLAIPNQDGVLVVSREAVATISETEASAVDLIHLNRDVKQWQSNQSLSAVKAATEVKADDIVTDYKNVTFEGYGSTFKDLTPEDRDGDYIIPGAFDKTLVQFMRNPVMLTDHTRRVINLAGKYTKASPTKGGLLVQGELSNSPHTDMVHARFLVMEGSLKTLSIGGYFFYGDDWRGVEEIDLHEISLVVIPANPDAVFTVRAPSLDGVTKAFQHAKTRGGGAFRQKLA